MGAGREFLAGAGTQNAGLAFGGFSLPLNPTSCVVACTEEYSGTSWSTGGAMTTARQTLSGAGTQNAAIGTGGLITPSIVGCTEQYDGTSWSTGGALSTARCGIGLAGLESAAIGFGGSTTIPATGVTSCTEKYNGVTWSTGVGFPGTPRFSTAAGTQNSGLLVGSPATGVGTVKYQGDAYSTDSPVNVPRTYLTVTGNQASALAWGACSPITVGHCTEEYNLGVTVALGVWKTTDSLTYSHRNVAGLGTQPAALAIGGTTPAGLLTEEYNGLTWSDGGDLNTARCNAAAAGTQNEGVIFGGYCTPVYLSATEEYNGGTNTWTTSSPGLNTGRCNLGGSGTQAAALAFGGNTTAAPFPYNVTCTEEYNGGTNTWTTVTPGLSLTCFLRYRGAGTQNATFATLGINTEEYDGSSWATGPNMVLGTPGGSNSAGTISAGISFGNGIFCTGTENYDGTAWSSSVGTLVVGTIGGAGAGTQAAALRFGGNSPSDKNAQEYDGSLYTVGIKQITIPSTHII